ncbi:MAG: internal scaffolding protein [Microvirus sp.]|nr:MAG: internal scaffolding protein [Microvirus sp.]
MNERNDNALELKWSGKRIVRDETTRIKDPGIDFTDDPGKTDHSQAKECDVNVIVARMIKTGVSPAERGNPVYGDYSDVPSYQEALNIVHNAEEQFRHLDAVTRARFSNDPSAFLQFVGDARNTEEMVKLGLAIPRKPDSADAILGELKRINKPADAPPQK